MLHPVLVVALVEVFPGVGAAAFGAVRRPGDGDHRLADQVLELQGLHQVGVPDQAAVGHLQVAALGLHPGQALDAVVEAFARPVDRSVLGHDQLHLGAQVRRRHGARGVPQAVEAGHVTVGPGRFHFRLAIAGLQGLGAAQADGPAEHHQVDERIGAETV